jgi:general secretion pathway protein K
MRPALQRKHGDAGLALVAVLWGLAILSLIAAAMLAAGVSSVRMSRNAWAQTQAQAIADAGIQRAILSLLDARADHKWRTDDVAQAFAFGGANITITIQDELGRIDLNFASKDRLGDLLQSVGSKADDASTLAGRIVDWRTPASQASLDGTSAADYRTAGLSYLPRGGPFQSVDEAQLVLGMTPELFVKIAPALTVYSHRPDFDMRTAPMEVLMVVPGMDEQKAQEIIAARAPQPSETDSAALGAAFNQGAIATGHAFAIRSDVQLGNIRCSREAMIELTTDPVRRFWILDWK